MNNKIKSYVVSSANWEIEVDSESPMSAAISAMLIAFRNFKKNLMVSTVVMVNTKNGHLNNDLQNSDFFATFNILDKIGEHDLSKNLMEYMNLKYES